MNSIVGPIFNEKIDKKWNLWVREQCINVLFMEDRSKVAATVHVPYINSTTCWGKGVKKKKKKKGKRRNLKRSKRGSKLCLITKNFFFLGRRTKNFNEPKRKKQNLFHQPNDTRRGSQSIFLFFFFEGEEPKNFNEPKRKKQNLFHQPNDTRRGSQSSFFFFLRSQSSLFIDFFLKYIFLLLD